ncbi:hypothetical protein Ddc_14947 [Ditylenchus destructor]|nr:hypothetical protein Ddc_14947 [Ditylenchus destructor]
MEASTSKNNAISQTCLLVRHACHTDQNRAEAVLSFKCLLRESRPPIWKSRSRTGVHLAQGPKAKYVYKDERSNFAHGTSAQNVHLHKISMPKYGDLTVFGGRDIA